MPLSSFPPRTTASSSRPSAAPSSFAPLRNTSTTFTLPYGTPATPMSSRLPPTTAPFTCGIFVNLHPPWCSLLRNLRC
ncbi:hypothetical protein HN51_046905 [Arachis hypogaea]